MSDDNNSDFNKEVIEMELSSAANNAQRDCNLTVVKLELFGNIPLVSDTNDLEHHKKAVHNVESSSAKRNSSIVEGAESSSAECNPIVIQGVESSSAEYNASVPAKLLVVNMPMTSSSAVRL